MLCRVSSTWHRHHTLDSNQKNDDMRKFSFHFLHSPTLINWICNCWKFSEVQTFRFETRTSTMVFVVIVDAFMKNRLCLSKGLDAKLIISTCFDNKHNLLEKNVFCTYCKESTFSAWIKSDMFSLFLWALTVQIKSCLTIFPNRLLLTCFRFLLPFFYFT